MSFQEVSSDQAGQRIDNFLLSRLKGVPKSRIYRIIRKGEVRVNKKRVKPEYKLQSGDLVRIPPVRVAEPRQQVPPSESLQDLLQQAILFEDDCLLILNKPAGLPVHAGTGVKTGLIEALRFMYPDLTALELAHRIDKGTSGCLVVAKTAKALKALSAQFKAREVKKTYHALVHNRWPEDIKLLDKPLLRQEPMNGERFVVVSSDGKAAQTHFAIVEHLGSATLIEASPHTGRTHQIRVHTQFVGCPIVGDEKYSPEKARKVFADKGIKRLCLHAASLTLKHPESGEMLSISAPLDRYFSEAIALLRQEGG